MENVRTGAKGFLVYILSVLYGAIYRDITRYL